MLCAPSMQQPLAMAVATMARRAPGWRRQQPITARSSAIPTAIASKPQRFRRQLPDGFTPDRNMVGAAVGRARHDAAIWLDHAVTEACFLTLDELGPWAAPVVEFGDTHCCAASCYVFRL